MSYVWGFLHYVNLFNRFLTADRLFTLGLETGYLCSDVIILSCRDRSCALIVQLREGSQLSVTSWAFQWEGREGFLPTRPSWSLYTQRLIYSRAGSLLVSGTDDHIGLDTVLAAGYEKTENSPAISAGGCVPHVIGANMAVTGEIYKKTKSKNAARGLFWLYRG